jgi:REP element-mobilizing transposase RayT
MQQPIAYMLTWTTYGSLLQGDEHGYVKDGMIHEPNKRLNQVNKALMKYPEVNLTLEQRQIVINALRKEAGLLGQEIYAIAVGKNHIHLAVNSNDLDAGMAVSHCKNAARLAIQHNGFIGKLWTRGFSKRYCFDEQQLQAVIAYVNGHNKSETPQVHLGG